MKQPIIIGFDVDMTLVKEDGTPRYEIIDLLRLLFITCRCKIVVGSGGGIDYAETVVERLGISNIVTIVDKVSFKADIWIDDQETEIGTVNLQLLF